MKPQGSPIPVTHAGFTLLEVLLALGLTALLMGLISTGVFVVAGDWNRNSDRLDTRLDEALGILQIDRALHGAFPHSFANLETLSRQVYFDGQPDRLRWVSTVSPQRVPGLMAWDLYTEPDEGVYLRLAPAFADDPTPRLENATPILILPGYSVAFQYLFQAFENQRDWQDEWQGGQLTMLPLAIHVQFTPLRDAEAESEPFEILARVRAYEHRGLIPTPLQVQP